MKQRSEKYQVFNILCSGCNVDTGATRGVDPLRGHKPYDPKREKFFCATCAAKPEITMKGVIMRNADLSMEQKISNVQKAFADGRLTEEQAKEGILALLIGKKVENNDNVSNDKNGR